jgi:hypothetical protein
MTTHPLTGLAAAATGTLGTRAAALGHVVDVEHAGKRFRLVCSCGFRTSVQMKRRTAFQSLTEHLTTVVREGVSLPETVRPAL